MVKAECSTPDRMRMEAWGPYCPELARLIKQWILPGLE